MGSWNRVVNDVKKCSKCGVIKSTDQFSKQRQNKCGVRADCKECRKREYDQHRHVILARHKVYKLKQEHALTFAAYMNLLVLQHGCCAICGTRCNTKSGKLKRRLDVDHDHITGRIRGLLCNNCNTALGKVKDSVVILERMITYLKQNENALTQKEEENVTVQC